MVCETEVLGCPLLPESSGHGAFVVVDPLSSGAVLAQLMMDRGYAVIRVLSTEFHEEILALLPVACKSLQFAATIQHKGDVDDTLAQIKALDYDILGITVGCESGVELSDALSARHGKVPTNGEELSHHRRDKYLMGEKIREAGLRAARQVETNKWQDVEAFVKTLYGTNLERMKIVLKPCRSAGTENVFFSSSLEEAKKAFDIILGDENIFGEINDMVLVQEFLQGTEYVIDSVSRRGEHKVVDIFVYDKRPANNSQFVYFGVNLYESADGQKEQKMAEYIFKVLDALGIREGPSHAEVMWLDHEDQPCLVEVGARPHGGEGTFTELSTPGIGYNQLEVMLWALEDNGRFETLPSRPRKLKAHAREVTLVSRQDGILRDMPMLDKVQALPSYKSMEIKVQPGHAISKTTDFLTTPGSIMLVNASADVVIADYEQIHQWEAEDKFYDVMPAAASIEES